MKKFFLVLLFCVFPFQVLAGDVSYWADGQIKRKGVSGKVVAIGMAWNGSGCLVKKAPNREEGGFSVIFPLRRMKNPEGWGGSRLDRFTPQRGA